MTKISIITVVYNGEKTIESTIQSIISQKNIDLEYIVIDGYSTDSTPDLIRKYKQNINHLVTEPDNGIYDAMNKGLKIASGEVIGFLNSDDFYNSEDTLSKVVSQFESDLTTDLVYGDLVYVDPKDINQVVRLWQSCIYYDKFFNNGLVPPHPSFFVRKSAYEKAGHFDIKFKYAADFEIMFRLLKIYNLKSIYIPNILVRMRLGGATNRSVSNIIKGNLEIANVWKIHKERIPITFWFKRIRQKLIQFSPKNSD
jgi:glycosyltransferase involved in cell wall biosynthesis